MNDRHGNALEVRRLFGEVGTVQQVDRSQRFVVFGFEAGEVRVLHGKGDKARTVGIDEGALAVLQRWLDVRAARKVGRSATVFCTLKGDKLDAAYLRQLLPRLARKAGIEKRIHAHGFRHTHAAQLAAEGVPMNLIQRVLGHTNLSTTSRYIDHIAPTKIIEAMRSRSWSL